MPFIVKAPAYLDQFGQPVMHRNQAHRFSDEDKLLAETAAELANGEVVRVVVVERKRNPVKPKPTKKKKANQSWMRGLKK